MSMSRHVCRRDIGFIRLIEDGKFPMTNPFAIDSFGGLVLLRFLWERDRLQLPQIIHPCLSRFALGDNNKLVQPRTWYCLTNSEHSDTP